MRKRWIVLIAATVVALAGGFVAYQYMFSTETTYAEYTAPTFEAGATDEQRIFELQDDLGNAAAEMAELEQMASKLQFGKMKAMGRHLQQVADELEPRLDEIEHKHARSMLAQGIDGLRMVGEGSEELDKDKSLRGVQKVLDSFDDLQNRA
jgi:hypothetical protein